MRFECAGTSVSFTAEPTKVRLADAAVVVAVAVVFRLVADALRMLAGRCDFRLHLCTNTNLKRFCNITRNFFNSPHSSTATPLALRSMCSIERMASDRRSEVATANPSPTPATARPCFLVLRLRWLLKFHSHSSGRRSGVGSRR